LKLFTSQADNYKYRTWKIQIAAQYAGVNLDVVDSAGKEFKAASPSGKAPVLSTFNGSFFESNAILRYIARLRRDSGLYGDSFHEAALVDQWVDFSSNELEPTRHIWLLPVQGVLQFNGKAYSEARKELADALALLNSHLADNTFLVGNHVTIADIAIATALVEPYRELFDQNYRKPFGEVTRWFTTVINQREFQAVVGKVEFAKQEKRAPKPAKPEGGEGGEQKGKPQQQQQQPKQAQQPKQPKQPQQPKEKKEEKAAGEDGGEEDAPKPKVKNPIDLLPASPMQLDSVKKILFSQRPWNPDFFKDFWPNFDAQGYSIWHADYQYNHENRVYFMTCNLLGGFLQRCDDARRYALGVMVLAGNDEDAPPFEISGVWIFRGLEVPREMKDNPDSEYYTFSKLDSNNADHRKRIETYFFADDVPNSKGNGTLKALDRRFFK